MRQIDKEKMKAFEQQAQLMSTKVKTLCDQGMRDQAQEFAMEYDKNMMKDPIHQKIRQCSEPMSELMPMKQDIIEELKTKHVCDEHLPFGK